MLFVRLLLDPTLRGARPWREIAAPWRLQSLCPSSALFPSSSVLATVASQRPLESKVAARGLLFVEFSPALVASNAFRDSERGPLLPNSARSRPNPRNYP